MKKKKIGLALGSGGARGLAHIGVIKELEKSGIKIDYIAGTSIGSIVGGIYASGKSIKEIEKVTLEANWRMVLSMIDPHLKQGLVGGKKVRKFIEEHIAVEKIEDCKTPFRAVATDLLTGKKEVIKRGKIVNALMASSSIPLFFKPVKRAGKILVDGGLSAPVPACVVREMGADVVIAVNLDRYYCDEKSDPGFYGIAYNSLSILRHNLAKYDTQNADVAINLSMSKRNWYKFNNGEERIKAGEDAMKKEIKKLKDLI